MSYRLIRGKFYVVGYQPDGDSIRFKADRKKDWAGLGSLSMNTKNHVQLRFQGIDTPETHVSNKYHQPLDLAFPARDRLLQILGITNVQFGNSQHKVTSAQEGTKGTLLISGLTFKRPISFVFKGSRFSGTSSGSSYTPNRAQIRSSVNYKLVEEGHAYPLFYKELDAGFRDDFTYASIIAYNKGRGLWPYDWSESFSANSLNELEDYYCVFPKIFRRLVKYMKNGSSTYGFVNALRNGQAGENDRLALVSDPSVKMRLADVLEQGSSKTVKMKYYPEELIFG